MTLFGIHFVGGYFPPIQQSVTTELVDFFQHHDELLDNAQDVFLIGDINARLGEESGNTSISCH